MSYVLQQRQTCRDGFQWWWTVAEFKTEDKCWKHKRLYYKNSAAPLRVIAKSEVCL